MILVAGVIVISLILVILTFMLLGTLVNLIELTEKQNKNKLDITLVLCGSVFIFVLIIFYMHVLWSFF